MSDEKSKNYFWYNERLVFIAGLLVFMASAILLTITEYGNPAIRQFNTFKDHLFNSVSVGTLTGLARGDVGNYTFWGQFVLLGNMVISGIITSFLAVAILLFFRLGSKSNSLKKFLSDSQLDSKHTFIYTLVDLAICWGLSAIIFYFAGLTNIWEAIFNSASHLFNDGVTVKTGNFVEYANNFPLILAGGMTIIFGGLGISARATMFNFITKKLGLKTLANLVPENVLAPMQYVIPAVLVTLALQAIGAFAIYNFEINNLQTLGSNFYEHKWLSSWYMSVSTRTAGFTLFPDLSLFSDKSNIVMMVLMFIGAGSGSFAGGVLKLVGFIYIINHFIIKVLHLGSLKKYLYIFSLKMEDEYHFKVQTMIAFLTISTVALFFTETNLNGMQIIFEVISGVSNTGLSINATSNLTDIGMYIIMLLMIMGKVGFISFVISFSQKLQDHINQKPSLPNDIGVE